MLSFKSNFAEITNGFSADAIFNADETALFVHCVSSQSYVHTDMSSFGFKSSKKRVSILLCFSWTGEKLCPMIIGRSKKPRGYVQSESILYYANSKAWMTSVLFNEWLSLVNEYFSSVGKQILLFVDNCSSHKVDKQYSHLNIRFLPKNTTSVLQPLDAGIIRSFKCNYRNLVTRSLISNTHSSPTDLSFNDIIDFVVKSWAEITHSTIIKCFNHCFV